MKAAVYACAALLALAAHAAALEPPPAAGTSRGGGGGLHGVDPALGISNSSVSPDLARNFISMFTRGRGRALPSSRGSGMPSTGSPRMLVLLIDFDDYPARPGDNPQAVKDRIFGSGGKAPYESLSAYYRRASLGKLNIQGDVLGWYRAGKRADVPQTRAGRDELVKKALKSFDVDFSRYDNNGDGVIDYFAVVWTGPIGKWATFWWGCAPKFSDPDFTIGGEKLYAYSWQGVATDWDDPEDVFRVRTLIHETGHAMGLPDYDDYNADVGPKGGLGYFDMMDSAYYDHNCFSKMLLGWVEPKPVTFTGKFNLRAAEDYGDCAMFVPAGRQGGPFGEFYLVENRRRKGNDAEAPMLGGLAVWHVDARLNADGTDFLYNNQTTEHKLIKFMEADGLEELESGASKSVTQTDFFTAGLAFGPATKPPARFYDGSEAGFSMLAESNGDTASFSATVGAASASTSATQAHKRR